MFFLVFFEKSLSADSPGLTPISNQPTIVVYRDIGLRRPAPQPTELFKIEYHIQQGTATG